MEEKNKEKTKKEKKHSKIKIVLIVCSIILVLLIALSLVGYYMYNKDKEKFEKQINNIHSKNEKALLSYSDTIEYGTSWKYDEFLNNFVDNSNLYKNTNLKIYVNDVEITKDEEYHFDEVGTVKIRVLLSNIYEYKLIKKHTKTIENKKEVELIVEDTKFPIIDGISDKTITQGDTIELSSGITARDEVDGKLEIKTEGEVNTSKPGEYKIKVSSTDKNGNKTEKEFKVVVNAKKQVTTSSNKGSSTNSTNSNKGSSSNNNNNNNNNNSNNTSTDSSTKNGRLNLAKQEAKRVVSQIITPGMSEYQKAYAIFNYLHSNVSLQTNQSTEAYKTNYGNEAYAALIMKIAACSGFCKAVTLMCDAAGLQSQHINANLWTHQWNKVYVDGQWIILDAQGGIFGGTTHPLE